VITIHSGISDTSDQVLQNVLQEDSEGKVSFIYFSLYHFWQCRTEEMEAWAVEYSSCRMWEVRVTTSVPADFTCEKFTHFQLFTDNVWELELDELRIIRQTKVEI